MTDHLVRSAWKLKANLEIQATRDRGEKPDPDPSTAKGRIRSTELDRAFRSMKEAPRIARDLAGSPGLHDRIRGCRRGGRSTGRTSSPTSGRSCLRRNLSARPRPTRKSPSWNERLVYDFDVSEASPVVKGTWVTVAHVVSLIVDGWTWADILRSYPELSEDDIRTCVAYAMAEENTSL